MEQALLRFAQTADREFAAENGEGQMIGTLALLDLVLAEQVPAAFGAGVGPSLNAPNAASTATAVVRRPK